ncbi:30S ribosomal protein S16 [Candidatus Dojkabacteria bacterium]|uniref:Small ribosomal subunit protein bS16 n=1 Tax=Candidatus Dojkabacteria bacterium TaxID=2099670 RepID=A0A955RL38_9BACT|nr:30S ribosomal protein S16 [Candidatus Dojkabacteria bacterium]
MVRMRLTRVGRKNNPAYRVVVTPKREKRDSRAIEYLGHFSPMSKVLELNKERIEYWLSVGAQPSETVKRLLIKEKILKEDKKSKPFAKKAGRKKSERDAAKADAAEQAKEAAKAAKEAEAAAKETSEEAPAEEETAK